MYLYLYLYLTCQYLMYLIAENAKYLYLYLIQSTLSIRVLDQLYLTTTLVTMHITFLTRKSDLIYRRGLRQSR